MIVLGLETSDASWTREQPSLHSPNVSKLEYAFNLPSYKESKTYERGTSKKKEHKKQQ